MISDYFKLAYKSAKHRKLRSWLTMIGIFIGIAAVVALIALSQGLKDAIGQQFLGLGSDKLVVQAAGGGFGPPGTAVTTPLTTKDKKVIEKTKGVDTVVGRLIRIVELEVDDEKKFTYATTMPKDQEERELVMEANNYIIGEGKFFDKNSGYEVVIGHEFAQDFFEKKLEVRDTILVQGKEFKVTGILQKSGNPQQDSTLVLPEARLREILDVQEEFDVIPLRVLAGEDVEAVAENINKELRKSRDVEEGKEDFTVQTPGQIIAILNNILIVIQGVLVGIAAISLVVGAVGIMNTMYTAVLERTREIGVMKAVGAKNGEVMVLFMIESGFLGIIGGVIGVSLGVLISKIVEWIAFQQFQSVLIQANLPGWLLGGALLFAFVVGAASGVFPARQAARLHPVDALRK
jgi:putative ABC transport system permease protein